MLLLIEGRELLLSPLRKFFFCTLVFFVNLSSVLLRGLMPWFFLLWVFSLQLGIQMLICLLKQLKIILAAFFAVRVVNFSHLQVFYFQLSQVLGRFVKLEHSEGLIR